MNRVMVLLLVALGGSFHAAFSQDMTAPEILKRMKQQFEPINDYIASVNVSVDMERFQAPEMSATIYFKKPDKVHVDAKNFAMVPRQAIPVNPTQLIEKFDASLVGTERRGDSTLYKLRLVSKPEKGKPVTELYIWVDGAHWVVTHIEASPWELRKVTAELEYRAVENGALLPSRINVVMESQEPPDSSAERIYSPQRMPRKGSISIEYLGYKINTNFSDDIFEKKKGGGHQ
jgi:outer membrane lipoprotein-sorting protein